MHWFVTHVSIAVWCDRILSPLLALTYVYLLAQPLWRRSRTRLILSICVLIDAAFMIYVYWFRMPF